MNDKPLVSVVTATYNMAQYVHLAVDSILNQDYPNVEAIVVDDGSTDETPAVLSEYAGDPRVKVISQPNAGQTVAKNRGLTEAQGEFVGFCDADNIWRPGKLSLQIPCFLSEDQPGVVYGDVNFIDENGNNLPTPTPRRHSGRVTGKLLASNFVPFNTCVVPRKILTEAGGFDESLSMAIDYDLWLRLSVRHEFLHLPEKLVDYRIWGGQMSHRTGERLDNALRMMDNFIARHPQAVSDKEKRHAWAYTFTTKGQWHAREGRRTEALRQYNQALQNELFDQRTWKSIVKLALGR